MPQMYFILKPERGRAGTLLAFGVLAAGFFSCTASAGASTVLPRIARAMHGFGIGRRLIGTTFRLANIQEEARFAFARHRLGRRVLRQFGSILRLLDLLSLLGWLIEFRAPLLRHQNRPIGAMYAFVRGGFL